MTFLFIYLFIQCTHWCMYSSQRTSFRNQFFPSDLWVPWVELSHQAQQQTPPPVEPSCQPRYDISICIQHYTLLVFVHHSYSSPLLALSLPTHSPFSHFMSRVYLNLYYTSEIIYDILCSLLILSCSLSSPFRSPPSYLRPLPHSCYICICVKTRFCL